MAPGLSISLHVVCGMRQECWAQRGRLLLQQPGWAHMPVTNLDVSARSSTGMSYCDCFPFLRSLLPCAHHQMPRPAAAAEVAAPTPSRKEPVSTLCRFHALSRLSKTGICSIVRMMSTMGI